MDTNIFTDSLTIQLTTLAERAHEFSDFGEAEQFLFQVRSTEAGDLL